MAELPFRLPSLTPPKQMSRHIFAVLALLALGAAVGLWYYFNQTTVETLKLGAGMELKYREGLTDILCDEAESRDLKIEIQWHPQPLEAIQQVNQHELDAAIIPAGLSAGTASSRRNSPAGDHAGLRDLAPFRQAGDLRAGTCGTSRPLDLHGPPGHRGRGAWPRRFSSSSA